MIIKVNGSQLEIFENSNIYLGSPKKGQIFKKREELNENIINELIKIQDKAEDLIKQTEQLLSE